MSTSRQLLCPHCRSRLTTSSPVGETIACTACHAPLIVPEPAGAGAVWYVSRDGLQAGPFTWNQVLTATEEGRVLPSDFIWGPTLTSWVEAHTQPGLFPIASPPLAFPPVPSSADTSADIFEGMGTAPDETSGPLSMRGIQSRPQRSVTLGDFQILRKVGTGAMGAVYLALQHGLQRHVALKVLSRHMSDRKEFVQRFDREAEVMAQLDHPGIVRQYGVGEEQGMHYFAMEFVDGYTLSAVLDRRGGRLDVGDALHIVLRCAAALGYAHERGVVHRDVKPSNIMISRLGHVKLTDLGLARALDEDTSLTESGLGLGTPQYMAPEQGRSAKHADPRSDIYSLGTVLYRMLTGALPFEEESAMDLLLAKEQGMFQPARRRNDDVPPRLDLVIDKMLAKEPRLRHQSCAELTRDLETLGLAHEHLSFNPLHVAAPPAAPPAAYVPGSSQHVEILLADHDAGAILLAQEALAECGTPSNLSVVGDTQTALAFLERRGRYANAPRPNLILLGKDLFERGGLELILAVKGQPELRKIPFIVLTTSEQAPAVLKAHGVGTNLRVTTPDDLKGLQQLLQHPGDDSTVTIVMLPRA